MKAVVAVPRRLTQGVELVIVRRDDYERLQQHLVEVEDALGKSRRGEQEFRAGKTRMIRSLSELRR